MYWEKKENRDVQRERGQVGSDDFPQGNGFDVGGAGNILNINK